MHVPRGTLIGCRTDAIYLDHEPGWGRYDDGRPGRFRRVTDLTGPLAAPHSHPELVNLKAET